MSSARKLSEGLYVYICDLFYTFEAKMPLQNRIGSEPKVVLAAEDSDKMDGFSYLDSCISPAGRIYHKIFSHTGKSALTLLV